MINSHYGKLDRKNEDYFDLVLLDRKYNPKRINATNDYRKGENSIYMKDYTKKGVQSTKNTIELYQDFSLKQPIDYNSSYNKDFNTKEHIKSTSFKNNDG